MTSKNFIGVLRWEAGLVPRGLVQLEELHGNSTNLSTFDYPVVFKRVDGATTRTIMEEPDPVVHKRMLEAARELYEEGAAAITTSCGFNVILQERLSETVPIPVFSSSLIQVPWVFSLLSRDSEILVVTAKKDSLTTAHLVSAGIKNIDRCHIVGLEEGSEWKKIFTNPEDDIDIEIIREEVTSAVENALSEYLKTRAVVFECTDIPPFADAIRKKTCLPVFDFVTMLGWISTSLARYA
jgi:hypothetical protein